MSRAYIKIAFYLSIIFCAITSTVFIHSSNDNKIDFNKKINKNDLLNHIPSNLKKIGKEFIDKSFESGRRFIVDEKGKSVFGSEFCIHPEFVDYLMKNAYEKTILEVGGGSGTNSILLSLAGAKKVYMNDINKIETEKFKNNVKKLPETFRKGKFIAIPADIFKCFGLFKKNKIKFDIVVMRNVLHFFNKEKEEMFFKEIKKYMNPSALFYGSVNGMPFYNNLTEDDKKNCNTYFRFDSLFIQNKKTLESKPIITIRKPIKEVEKNILLPQSDEAGLIDFERIDKNSNKEEIVNGIKNFFTRYKGVKLHNQLENEIKKYLINNNAYLKKPYLLYHVDNKYIRYFNKKLLEEITKKHGLKTLKLEGIDEKGHSINSFNYRFVGIISIFDK